MVAPQCFDSWTRVKSRNERKNRPKVYGRFPEKKRNFNVARNEAKDAGLYGYRLEKKRVYPGKSSFRKFSKTKSRKVSQRTVNHKKNVYENEVYRNLIESSIKLANQEKKFINSHKEDINKKEKDFHEDLKRKIAETLYDRHILNYLKSRNNSLPPLVKYHFINKMKSFKTNLTTNKVNNKEIDDMRKLMVNLSLVRHKAQKKIEKGENYKGFRKETN